MWLLTFSSVVLAVKALPSELLGTYTYVCNGDLYALQLKLHANDTADFDFIINNDYKNMVKDYPKYWALRGMDVQYDPAAEVLSFINSEEALSNFPQIADIQATFAGLKPITTPIKVTVLRSGALAVDLMKIQTDVPKTYDSLSMQALFDELYRKRHALADVEKNVKEPKDQVIVATADKKSAVVLWIAAPLALGMLDWLVYA